MAVTKIWPIKDSVRRVVEYAENPEKTQCPDLEAVLCYAGNREKTGQEQTVFVTGINCGRDTAFREMLAVQEQYDKMDGNVAYHAYQSFRPGEVTPQQCHQIGIELARQLWGERYQVLVATHFNTGTFHNHFVLNAVSFVDGKKFNCNRAAYRALSQTSDTLCRQYGLSVVEHPGGRTPRSLYFAEKQNAPTRYNLMRQAIDECIAVSPDFRYFAKSLARRGYVLDCTPSHKYPTIRAVGSKKSVRLYRLGNGYTVQEIQTRIFRLAPAVRYPAYQADRDHYIALRHVVIPKRRVKGSFRHTKKIGGFWALYLHYCYFFGLLPKSACAHRCHPGCRKPAAGRGSSASSCVWYIGHSCIQWATSSGFLMPLPGRSDSCGLSVISATTACGAVAMCNAAQNCDGHATNAPQRCCLCIGSERQPAGCLTPVRTCRPPCAPSTFSSSL